MIAKNPIIEGFYPDPSICVVGEDFYLVNSTFAYFPGVPVFHSKNLRDWEQIGNVLDRNTQLPLGECGQYAGIYAPMIRWHKGIFYMVTTNISGGGNFYVTATDPKGPWSEPNYLGEEQAKGIDPTLFFDEDDRCYYIGSRGNDEGERYPGDGEIWIQELDLKEKRLIGESKVIYTGSQKHALWPEGPHIYKKDGYYYVMIAEGGTEHRHSITIARSKNLLGPYEDNPCNPILTHRYFGMDYPVSYVGHGDLFEGPDKNWYMVMLASRPHKRHTMLGRETFLAKVIWEEGWPVVNPGIGHLEEKIELPFEENLRFQRTDGKTWHFWDTALPLDALMLRNPKEGMYSLQDKEGCLRLYLQKERLTEEKSPAYIGFRQKYVDYEVNTRFDFHSKKENEVAGVVCYQSDKAHIRFELSGAKTEKKLRVIKVEKGVESCVASTNICMDHIELIIKSSHLMSDFYYKKDGVETALLQNFDTSFISTEKAGGFCGCTLGMYASSNGEESMQYADFHWFSILKM